MKKVFKYLLILIIIISCGKENNNDSTNTKTDLDKSEIVGVWKNGDYFVSFSNDNYYEAYINDSLIDSGIYSLSDSTVTCINNYLSRTTKIKISKSIDKIKCSLSYSDNGNDWTSLNETYSKSTDIPTLFNHPISGKSYTWKALWGSFIVDCSTNFTSSNSGYEEVLNGNLKGVKRSIYYVYLSPHIYMQRYQINDMEHGSNTFNKNIPKILKVDVNISEGVVSFK